MDLANRPSRSFLRLKPSLLKAYEARQRGDWDRALELLRCWGSTYRPRWFLTSKARFGTLPVNPPRLTSTAHWTANPAAASFFRIRPPHCMAKDTASSSRRTGMDQASLTRLENGRQPNPTVDALWRYRRALGRQLVLTHADPTMAPHGHCNRPGRRLHRLDGGGWMRMMPPCGALEFTMSPFLLPHRRQHSPRRPAHHRRNREARPRQELRAAVVDPRSCAEPDLCKQIAIVLSWDL